MTGINLLTRESVEARLSRPNKIIEHSDGTITCINCQKVDPNHTRPIKERFFRLKFDEVECRECHQIYLLLITENSDDESQYLKQETSDRLRKILELELEKELSKTNKIVKS